MEAVRARILNLEQDREKLIANVNAINGAIQDCEFWLAELEEPSDGDQTEE